MKPEWADTKRGLTLLLSLIAVTSGLRGHAQGTINFVNLTAGNFVNAPVFESDGITKCSGSQFMAELLAGPAANNLASIATIGFLQGLGAGYFNGGVQYVNTIPPSATAWVQVDIWNTASGATFDQAKSSGLLNSWWQSSVFPVQLGGGFQGLPPAVLIGLGTSPVYLNGYVPEPSTLALAFLGAAMLVFRVRGRKSARMSMR